MGSKDVDYACINLSLSEFTATTERLTIASILHEG